MDTGPVLCYTDKKSIPVDAGAVGTDSQLFTQLQKKQRRVEI